MHGPVRAVRYLPFNEHFSTYFIHSTSLQPFAVPFYRDSEFIINGYLHTNMHAHTVNLFFSVDVPVNKVRCMCNCVRAK